jgi:N-acetylglucosaminyldiphosphoundecaprenol N-acetyl-beta-D-mannosaminyltransferase
MAALNPLPKGATVGIRSLDHVDVGPFRVLDATRTEFVRRVVTAGAEASGEPAHVYALHVGGLNERHNAHFVDAMSRADLIGADGGSVLLLARLVGARSIERVATTDVGWDVLRDLAVHLGRPVRVALVGGPVGLAARAGEVLSDGAPVQIVHVEHGYHQDWTAPLRALSASVPDVTIVGLGVPFEMIWCQRHRAALTGRLVLTCGGWFGHLVGDEARAPRLLRHPGLEWIARVAQSPRRLGPRYVQGSFTTAVMASVVLSQQLSQRFGSPFGNRRR